MARKGRPEFKPTKGQRDHVIRLRADGWSKERIARVVGIDADTLVKHFADELEHGGDLKRAELLELAHKGARKGNAALIKWLSEQNNAGRAALQLEGRASQPPEEPKAAKLGKKDEQAKAAGDVVGKFAPPAGPSKLH